MRKLNLLFLIALLPFLALTGCDKEIDSQPYIPLDVDVTSFTFDKDGSNKLVVRVISTDPWAMDEMADWLSVIKEESDNEGVTITARPNESPNSRKTEVKFSAGEIVKTIEITQQGRESRYFEPNFKTAALSANGKFIAGVTLKVDEQTFVTSSSPLLIDLESGEETSFDVVDERIDVVAVDNHGVIYLNAGGMQGYRIKEGVFEKLPDYNGAPFVASAVSEDGRVLVGYSTINNRMTYVPLRCTADGVFQELEVSDKLLDGNDRSLGVIARGCSSDGSVIYGSCMDSFNGSVAWDRDGKMYYVAADLYEIVTINDLLYVNKAMNDANNRNISPNGRYIIFSYLENKVWAEAEGGDGRVLHWMSLGIYDTQTKQYTLEDRFEIIRATVTDDGLVFFSSRETIYDREYTNEVYDIASRNTTKLNKAGGWLDQNFGYVSENDYPVYDVSANKRVVLGYKQNMEDFWYLVK